MLPEIDMMDVGARQENLAVKGEPIMLQLCVVPAYALTVHKTQVFLLCCEKGSGVICIAWHFRTIPSVSFNGGALVAFLSK